MTDILSGTTRELCVERRKRLMNELGSGVVVFHGASECAPGRPSLYFRQSANFLYFTGLAVPGATIVLDADDRTATLFAPEQFQDDLVWDDQLPTRLELREASGIEKALPPEQLEAFLAGIRSSGRELLIFSEGPPADDERARELFEAVVTMRLVKSEDEIRRITEAMEITERVHRLGMAVCAPGAVERQVRAFVHAGMEAAGCRPSFASIATGRGAVLHGRSSDHTLRSGQMFLLDAGLVAENGNGAVTDITRSFPVGGVFTAEQAAIYDIVLAAVEAGIGQCRAGNLFSEVHRASSMAIIDGLLELGLLRGNRESIYECDAHAVFFPHGVGHFVGFDIFPCHDFEVLGEAACYRDGRVRASELLGRRYLRIDQKLQPNQVVTVEPGIYFVQALINDPVLQERYRDFVNLERAQSMLDFGGIRIEDNVLVTAGAPRNLSVGIPRTRAALESIIGSSQGLLDALPA